VPRGYAGRALPCGSSCAAANRLVLGQPELISGAAAKRSGGPPTVGETPVGRRAPGVNILAALGLPEIREAGVPAGDLRLEHGRNPAAGGLDQGSISAPHAAGHEDVALELEGHLEIQQGASVWRTLALAEVFCRVAKVRER
jgi:hypothetical protein